MSASPHRSLLRRLWSRIRCEPRPCDCLHCRDGGMAWVEANWKYLRASGDSDA